MKVPDTHTLSASAEFLSERLRRGDRKAFEIFYRMEYDNLLHFLRSYLRDSAVAEDLAQETFCSLWERRSDIDPSRNLRAYVFTAARNRALNHLKSRRPFGGANAPAALDESITLLEDRSLDGLIEALELRDLLSATYASMPEKTRKFFAESRVEGLQNKEIARRSHVSVKTVEYHIHSALEHFRKKLKKIK